MTGTYPGPEKAGMSKFGRNDPCPCGSGKKFKKCCGGASAEARAPSGLSETRALHERDRALVDSILRWATKTLGPDAVKDALAVYLDEAEEQDGDLEAGLMWTWLAYSCCDEEQASFARLYLDAHPRLDPADRALIEAQLDAPLSCFQVERVEPGRSLDLLDRLSLEEHHVLEAGASRSLVQHDLILARVMRLPDFSLLMGVHPRSLPPSTGEALVEAARKRLKARKGQPVSRAKRLDGDEQLELLYEWRDGVRARDSRPLPRLANTDGHELLVTRDRFSFESERRAAVVTGLLGLPGATDAGERGDGARIHFSRAGGPAPGFGDHTVIAEALVGADTLVLQTNSVERADALRARVEAALGSLVRFRIREHEDPLSAPAQAGARAKSNQAAPQVTPPELLAVVRNMREQHLRAWVDMEIPALDGRSPRAALKTKKGREQVEQLVREMENMEARLPEEQRIDLAPLRVELGLERP